MINKDISLGTILSLCTILATFIYTQGVTSQKIESIENDSKIAMTRVSNAENNMHDVNVKIAKIETKMDEGFKHIENLILHEL